jgi:hypothetical protein
MLEGVSVIAELEHFGIQFAYAGSETVKCKCCFHDDNSPSAVFRLAVATFECKSCGAKGDLVDFLAKYTNRPRVDILSLLAKRYNLTTHLRPISVELIEAAHSAIWDAEALRKELHKRCVTDDLIRRYRLGVRENRISIPVMDPGGRAYINIRSYLPGAPGAQKMKNLKGRGKLAIYPHDQLQYDTLMLTGGEMKAVASVPALNCHAIGAVAVTGGEGEWDNELNAHFSGKHVVIVFDIDEKGRKAAKKIARVLTPIARSIRIALLPLNAAEYPTGDVNDFLAMGGDLYNVIEKAESYDPRITRIDWGSGDYDTRTIDDAIAADNLGVRSSVSALITGVADQRFSVPRSVQVCCARDSKFCGQCPVAILDRDVYDIPSESPNVIAMLEATDAELARVLDRELSVPSKCTAHGYSVIARHGAEIAIIAPPLELKATSSTARESQKIIVLGDGVDANEEYVLEGRAQPSPKNQETVLLISSAKKKTSSLSRYVFEHSDLCSVFQPPDWSAAALELHLNDIYDAMASITGIRERRDLHCMIDLVYHSVLQIQPEVNIERGWVEALILGDSSQGKTQATIGMQRHYGLGHKVDSKNSSVAGLIGGLQKLNGMWMITWGALPTHDQRLVILEELKGAKVEVISALTDVRTSGIATLEKIRAGRRLCRTRILALSNPRSSRPMNTYSHGVEAILELIGAPEDVRRFDACMVVAKDDISYDIIHQLHEIKRHHPYTSEACHHNVMWAWTRRVEQIKFPRPTWAAILDASRRLCKKYSEQIPIVDAGSMRLKLARLCASLAARTFSTEDEENLLVRECHVEVIDNLLNRLYDSNGMRYNTYSERQNRLLAVLDKAALVKDLCSVPFPRKLVEYLHGTSWLTVEELQHHGGLDRSDGEHLIGSLARNYAISQKGRNYVASPGFRSLLDELVKELPNDSF